MPQFTLMQHQIDGVKFLDDMDGVGALLFDPGVGKTGTTLSWIDKLAQDQGDVRVLVVSPKTAVDTWVTQPEGFMDSVVKARMLTGSTLSILKKIAASRNWSQVPSTKVSLDHMGTEQSQVSGNRVTILSMGSGAISSFCKSGTEGRKRTVMMLKAIRRYDPHVVVVDESHLIKSHNSNVSKALYQIGQLSPHRIILTGTVFPLGPLDAYGQWRFLAPWTFSPQHGEAFTEDPVNMTKAQKASIKPWAWTHFVDRYARKGGFEGKQIVGVDEDAITDLHERVAERSMVVLKKDALDLPPTSTIDIHVDLNAAEKRAYKEMHDHLQLELASGELIESPNALSKIMKLRQIAGGFVKDTETGEVHVIGDSIRKGVQEIVDVQLAGEDRIVVFSYFKAEIHDLADKLAKKGRVIEVVTGATKSEERLAIRRRFGDRDGHPENIVLIAQVGTMSLSVNELITAANAVYASPTDRRDQHVQSRDRLDRKGQTRPVTFWNVYPPGTVGEVILRRHEDRGDLQQALFDHIKNTVRI